MGFSGCRQSDDARFREGGGALETGGGSLREGRRVLGVIYAAVEGEHQLGAGLLVLGEQRRFEFLDGGIALGRSPARVVSGLACVHGLLPRSRRSRKSIAERLHIFLHLRSGLALGARSESRAFRTNERIDSSEYASVARVRAN